jgi:ABC-type molybdate transport system substrate-binding protein
VRLRGALLALVLMASPAAAQDPVRLYAAGSLRAVLDDVAKQFADDGGLKVAGTYGASGLLRDRIDKGEKAELFASANMAHPRMLAKAGKAGPVVLFARNQLCALARPGLDVEPLTVLETMLDPAVKLGTSTPRADPSGDYAWEVFAKADKLRAGNSAALEKKALKLTGGPNSPAPPPDRSLYAMLVERGDADLFLTYCTNAVQARREVPGLKVVSLPPELAVGADYGLTVLNGARPEAARLAFFILSPSGQAIFARYGFTAVALPGGP